MKKSTLLALAWIALWLPMGLTVNHFLKLSSTVFIVVESFATVALVMFIQRKEFRRELRARFEEREQNRRR